MNQPLTSIIIVNYNGEKYLNECLESLKKINYTNFEIILIDNHSSDNSIKFARSFYPEIKIIELQENLGFAEPNNIGAREAKGDFLLFLNNDTVVQYNFLTELINVAIKEETVAILQSLLLKPNHKTDSAGDFFDLSGIAYSSKNIPKTVTPILSARGASMMMRKKVFDEFGGFDKKFFATFEDVDLGWRAWIHGYKVLLVPSSVVYHKGGQTVKTMSNQIKFHGAKNTLLLMLVNFEKNIAFKTITSLFFSFILGKKVSVMNNTQQLIEYPSLRVILNASGWIVRNLIYVYKKQKQIESRRIRTTKELIEMGLITKR
jgi:GT2 family glycosyltransferase